MAYTERRFILENISLCFQCYYKLKAAAITTKILLLCHLSVHNDWINVVAYHMTKIHFDHIYVFAFSNKYRGINYVTVEYEKYINVYRKELEKFTDLILPFKISKNKWKWRLYKESVSKYINANIIIKDSCNFECSISTYKTLNMEPENFNNISDAFSYITKSFKKYSVLNDMVSEMISKCKCNKCNS
jgi:hypothetical protein